MSDERVLIKKLQDAVKKRERARSLVASYGDVLNDVIDEMKNTCIQELLSSNSSAADYREICYRAAISVEFIRTAIHAMADSPTDAGVTDL